MKQAQDVTAELLRSMPVPFPQGETDKDSRGKVVVIGGSRRAPGGVILSGIAALRAGAGKALLGVPESMANSIAVAFLEAGVAGYSETAEGHPSSAACNDVCGLAQESDVVLIGPGLMDEGTAHELTLGVLKRVNGALFVIDAMAMSGLWNARDAIARHANRVIITPHAGEMATMMGVSREQVVQNPLAMAQRAADHLQCFVVLKGATTFIVSPDGNAFVHKGGCVGLATAGSGDVLAGMLAGLAARGAPALHASLWSVFIHGKAGALLTERLAPLGFLARELLETIPALLDEFDSQESDQNL